MEGAIAGLPGADADSSGTAPPALRPLGVGETLDAAIKLYRRNATTLWTIVAIVVIPLQILDTIVRRVSLPSDVFLSSGTLYSFSGQSTGSVIVVALASFLVAVATYIATGGVFEALISSYLGRPATWRKSLQHAGTRAASLIWLAVLSVVFVFIGFILLFIPGLWLLVAISVAVPALMFEGVGGFAAMKRSMDLVDGRWWATFGRLLAAYVLLFAVLFGITALIGAIASGVTLHNVTLYETLIGLANVIAYILVTPFVSAVLTVIYIDLRVRKEALDLELLAQQFTGPGSTVPPQPAVAAAPPAPAGPMAPAPTPAQSDLAGPTDPAPPSEPTWPPAG
jgi:hypothetical protein